MASTAGTCFAAIFASNSNGQLRMKASILDMPHGDRLRHGDLHPSIILRKSTSVRVEVAQ
jgi:hypothetical protein